MLQDIPYQGEKRVLRERLEALAVECRALQRELSIDLTDVLEKVHHGISSLERQRLTIAVFGPFSDGKSTILSMLMQRTDIPIAPEPTTNKVCIYETEDWLLCDTPGLFSEHPEHAEQTLRYVSEAHLVLFVVNPSNPLKESHHATVRWLLNDMGKRDVTIFVLSKMDKVADLEDPTDFQYHAKLKADVLRETLQSIMGRGIDVPVLALAADPYQKGVAYWLEHAEEYRTVARLAELERHVRTHVDAASQQLIVAAGMSVVRDAVIRATEQIREMHAQIEPTLRVFNNRVAEISQDVDRLERQIAEAYTAIKSDVMERRKGLLLDLDACQGLDQVVAFLQREVGNDGHVLNNNLEVVIQRHTQVLGSEVSGVMKEMEHSIQVHEGMLTGLGKTLTHPVIRGALDSLRSTSAKELSQGILWLRDTLRLPIKFKSWGAIKLGHFIKFAAWLGPVIEGGQVLADWLSERKLKQTVTEVKGLLEDGFQEFLEEFSQAQYVQKFFPELSQFRDVAAQLHRQRQGYSELSSKLFDGELRLKTLIP
jgi:GTP-binding protein EngB required for normal cell division